MASADESDAKKGNFEMPTIDELYPELQNMDFLFDDDLDLLLNDLTMPNIGVSFIENTQEMNDKLKLDEEGNLQSTLDHKQINPQKTRFGNVSNEELLKYYESNQSKNTRKNTKWEWCVESQGHIVDFMSINADELASLLTKFYCEAKPKQTNARQNSLPSELAGEYHKNTLKNIRAALNRHLQDLGRNLDIVNASEFKVSNKILNGLLKQRMQEGLSRPTAHKEIIIDDDLKLIAIYFKNAEANLIILKQCVWFNLATHFVTRGIEFHHQLKIKSFTFKNDNFGEYAVLNHEVKQKNFQGGLGTEEAPSDKRMYTTGSETCPIKMLKLLINKTDDTATHLFNQYNKAVFEFPSITSIWFVNKPLTKRTLTNFMSEICKLAQTSKIYTPHCLRATAMQHMNNAGHETRHIMFMSGHRNESSIRSYNRHCSTQQKKKKPSVPQFPK
ncbi:uncharacterized protein LOC134252097 [Saccostrea cucullata]|uniref:uncharacterized protein LOC134252097 n=1 Tax=Saccostrea cuccullata TaxID=36930 RepID=UPI002ED33732